MSKHYLIFKEENYYFAVDPKDFDAPVSLEDHWVTPLLLNQALWRFESKADEGKKGMFLQVGSLFGLTNSILTSKGVVMMHRGEDYPDLGLCFSDLVMKLPKKNLDKNRRSSKELYDFPLDMPLPAVRHFFKWRGKRILLIQPINIFEAFRVLPQGGILSATSFQEFINPLPDSSIKPELDPAPNGAIIPEIKA